MSPASRVSAAPPPPTHTHPPSPQAEQLTASSRAASRLQDLESLRFLERVGKGGYGSVYRGLYHGAEVAIKVGGRGGGCICVCGGGVVDTSAS